MKTNTDSSVAIWHRPIFRAAAVRRYVQNQQKTVLPRFVCPRTFLYLWILLGLLFLAGGFVGWLVQTGTFVAAVLSRVHV